MKNFLPALLVVLLTATGGLEAASKRSTVEPTAPTASGFRHEVLLTNTYLDAQVLDTDGIIAGVAYLYSVLPWLQLGGKVSGGYDKNGEVLGFQIIGNVTFPVAMGRIESVFFGGSAGWNDVTQATRKFAWRGNAGVRVPLATHAFWRPSLVVRDDGTGPYFAAELLTLSLRY